MLTGESKVRDPVVFMRMRASSTRWMAKERRTWQRWREKLKQAACRQWKQLQSLRAGFAVMRGRNGFRCSGAGCFVDCRKLQAGAQSERLMCQGLLGNAV